MRTLGEQWVENGRMYKAVEGPKIVNGLMEGNTCHGCCYVDKWDDDCLNPNQACPVGKGVIIKDLGPVNEDGCLVCPFCGESPKIGNFGDGFSDITFYVKHNQSECVICGLMRTKSFKTKQQAIDAWNRRV